jgi:hypothetical protein
MAAPKALMARLLALLDASGEGLIGPLRPQDDILQDLGADLGILGKRRFEVRQFGLLPSACC